MFFVIINLIILFGCDDVIIYLKKLCIYGFFFFLEIRLKIDNYLFNYFYYNRYRNYGNWEL